MEKPNWLKKGILMNDSLLKSYSNEILSKKFVMLVDVRLVLLTTLRCYQRRM